MKFITMLLFFLLPFPLTAGNGDCPSTPDGIKKAIESHIRKIRADEYCNARTVKTEGSITIAVYTAEGSCEGFSKKAKAGTCSNDWVRYMIGSINDKIIGPLIVGGKGDLTDDKLIILENTIELSGLSIGPNDSMCCPSKPKTKIFKFSQGGFSEIKP
jgi:hypothetical protein